MNEFKELTGQEILNICTENNDFSVMTDEEILNLTNEEFGSVFGWESFMARLFEMERFRELDKYLDQIDLFTLVYFWYSTNLGLELEVKYVKNLEFKLWERVWQELGQYVKCGWPAVKFMKDTPKKERGNMDGQKRYLTETERMEVFIVMNNRIWAIRKGLKNDGEEYIVC